MAGRFTALDSAQVAELAAACGLGDVVGWQRIEAGTINSNFAVATTRGRFFLRINEGKSEAQVAYEAALVRALAEAGVVTPVPLPGPEGVGYLRHGSHLVTLFPWVVGEHRGPAQLSPGDATRVGDALAGLHLAGAGLPAQFHQVEGIYTTAEIERRFESFRDHDDPALAEAIAEIASEIAWLQQCAPARAAASRGIIHGDLFCDNVLFCGADRVALIDFEQASAGSFAYDLAVTILAWCFVDRFEPSLVAALVAGYRDRRPTTAADDHALYLESRAAAVRFTVTRITDVYLPGRAMPNKDFRRYLARLRELRQVGAHGFTAWLAGRQGAVVSDQPDP